MRPSLQSFAASLAFVVAACHAEVQHAPPEPVYGESEPNDSPSIADDFGYLAAGEHLCIAGDMSSGSDGADAFAFVVEGPSELDFRLSASNAWTDLDVWLFDPELWQYVGVFESAGPVEHGRIVLDTWHDVPLQLVVVPYGGAASYRLDVEVHPLGFAPLAAPAAPPRADAPPRPFPPVLSWSARRAALTDPR